MNYKLGMDGALYKSVAHSTFYDWPRIDGTVPHKPMNDAKEMVPIVQLNR